MQPEISLFLSATTAKKTTPQLNWNGRLKTNITQHKILVGSNEILRILLRLFGHIWLFYVESEKNTPKMFI